MSSGVPVFELYKPAQLFAELTVGDLVEFSNENWHNLKNFDFIRSLRVDTGIYPQNSYNEHYPTTDTIPIKLLMVYLGSWTVDWNILYEDPTGVCEDPIKLHHNFLNPDNIKLFWPDMWNYSVKYLYCRIWKNQ
jgi:hypothetical protein